VKARRFLAIFDSKDDNTVLHLVVLAINVSIVFSTHFDIVFNTFDQIRP